MTKKIMLWFNYMGIKVLAITTQLSECHTLSVVILDLTSHDEILLWLSLWLSVAAPLYNYTSLLLTPQVALPACLWTHRWAGRHRECYRRLRATHTCDNHLHTVHLNDEREMLRNARARTRTQRAVDAVPPRSENLNHLLVYVCVCACAREI